MSRSQMFKCHKRFASGREIAKDEWRLELSSSTRTVETINRVKGLTRKNCRLTVRMITDKCDFWFFPKLKSLIKGTHLGSVDKI